MADLATSCDLPGKRATRGPFDPDGIPLLDYRGDIGRQYNPIAIAQYGLARFNAWAAGGESADRGAWIAVADWLERAMRPNGHGVRVWMHDFDWPYRQRLRAPWYSGLAQGNGLSLLVRAASTTGELDVRRRRASGLRVVETRRRRGRRARHRCQPGRLD